MSGAPWSISTRVGSLSSLKLTMYLGASISSRMMAVAVTGLRVTPSEAPVKVRITVSGGSATSSAKMVTSTVRWLVMAAKVKMPGSATKSSPGMAVPSSLV